MTVKVDCGCKVTKITQTSSAKSAILNSSGTMGALNSIGQQAVSIADGIGTATYAYSAAQAGKTRAHVIVYTPSRHAIYSNATHGTLARTLASLRSG